MGQPTNLASFEDCIRLWDQAIASTKGVRAEFATYGAASNFRLRMNYARRLQREEACRLYPDDDPRWGKTSWDPYKITIAEDTEGSWWIYVEPVTVNLGYVEELE